MDGGGGVKIRQNGQTWPPKLGARPGDEVGVDAGADLGHQGVDDGAGGALGVAVVDVLVEVEAGVV